MNSDQLISIIKNWNAENQSVYILKEAFEAYGKSSEELCEDDEIWVPICEIDWAGKYAEISFDTPFMERNNIMTIDFEGNCFCYDFSIKNISTLLK